MQVACLKAAEHGNNMLSGNVRCRLGVMPLQGLQCYEKHDAVPDGMVPASTQSMHQSITCNQLVDTLHQLPHKAVRRTVAQGLECASAVRLVHMNGSWDGCRTHLPHGTRHGLSPSSCTACQPVGEQEQMGEYRCWYNADGSPSHVTFTLPSQPCSQPCSTASRGLSHP